MYLTATVNDNTANYQDVLELSVGLILCLLNMPPFGGLLFM